ncbi:MAG: ribonuclease PH [Bradymonadia bacterium]
MSLSEPRPDGRQPHALRPIEIELGIQRYAAGSALIKWGNTHVLCSATVEDKVPGHRLESGGGWISAEYALLPGSTMTRARRERGKVGGRTAEIQRLIARSLRAAVDLDALGPRSIWIDCDVVQADGGTRCASITGGYVALCLALQKLVDAGKLGPEIMPEPLAAVSLGVRNGQVIADLNYIEDASADVDLNFVSSVTGVVEIQGTAEGRPFTRAELDGMIDAGTAACEQLFEIQRAALRR